MGTALRVLLVEDCEDDAQLVMQTLRRGGYEPEWERVETAEMMRAALTRGTWDVVIADYSLPHFDGLTALRLVQESGWDVPFLLISGAIGEETAVAAMRAGAHDYVMKDRLSRLPAAVERELREAELRRAHRAAVAELHHSKETFELVVRGSADGIWDWNIVTQEDYLSDRWCQLLGYGPGELPQEFETWASRLHPEERDWVMERVRQHLEERVPYDIEYRMRTRSGEYRWFRASGQAVWDETGKPLRMAGSISDIDARKRAEEELRARERELTDFIENAAIGLHWVDENGTILWVNQTELNLLGYCREEYIGRPIADFHADRIVIDDILRRLIANETLENHEARLRCKDGSIRDVLISSNVLWKGGKFIHTRCFTRDITERNRAEEELRRAKEAAEAANRAKSEFLANISHEFRTPLNAILGLTRLVLETELHQNQREDLLIVQAAGESLLGLITDLLDFSQIEARKLELRLREFTLKGCLDQALELLRPLAEAKGLSQTCDVQPNVPERLIGDPERLHQVLVNLLGNAVKFTDMGSLSVRVEVETRTPDTVRLHFAVADTGIGIPADKRQTIFEPFTQADGSLTRKYGGTGLGLSITTRLVHLMGGTIRVESEVGQGSTFHMVAAFDLPPAASTKAKQAPDLTGRSAKPACRLRILVVEDSLFNQKLMTSLLTRNGHHITMADDGQKALDVWQQQPFDLILMDVQMPIRDGVETTRLLRQREAETGRHVPILALTAHASETNRARCLAAGMDGFLTKPFTEAEFWTAVAALLPNVAEHQPRVPIMDRPALLARVGGNPHAMQDLVQVFLEDSPKLEQDMVEALAAGDASGLHRAVHSLKGMLGYLGAQEAVAAALRLDALSKAADLGEAASAQVALQRALERVRPLLEEIVQDRHPISV